MNDDYTTPLAERKPSGNPSSVTTYPDGYVDEDAKKSMAIVNLQAMLGEDDVDKIIKLLQENNWDETVSH